MRGVLLLSWRRLRHERAQTTVLVLCLALAAAVPLTTRVLVGDWERGMRARADSTPLVCGTRGSPLDLTLSALYLRDNELRPLPLSAVSELGRPGEAVAIPVHRRATARGRPIVATTPEYFERRCLVPARGTPPLRLAECVLGADVARELDLELGDELTSDPRELYDLSVPPPLRLRVVGVLAARDTPDDGAVFTSLGTAWMLEGLAHAHQDAEEVDPTLLLGGTDDRVVLSPALVPDASVPAGGAGRVHLHADEDALPLTAVLLFPASEKSATLLRSRVNAAGRWQVIAPAREVDELFAVVFRVRAVFDTLSVVLFGTTGALLGLVVVLSLKLRAREMATLHRIGCPPGTEANLLLVELALVVGLAAVLAALAPLALTLWTPDLVGMLA